MGRRFRLKSLQEQLFKELLIGTCVRFRDQMTTRNVGKKHTVRRATTNSHTRVDNNKIVVKTRRDKRKTHSYFAISLKENTKLKGRKNAFPPNSPHSVLT